MNYLYKPQKWLTRLLGVAALALLVVMSPTRTWGQVNAYSFAQSSGTYTEISGGTILATASSNSGATGLDDVIYNIPALSFPFTFTFNGVGYTGCNVSTNGFITFGATAPATNLYTPISGTTAYAGAIAAWGRDLSGFFNIASRTSQIRWETVGSAPNREIVIQYKDMRPMYSTSATNVYGLSYQIRLRETTNTVAIVYGGGSQAIGSSNITSTTAPAVGLRGAANTDFNNRTGTSWAATTAGTLNSNTVSFATVTSPNMPASGLTFTWSPPSCVAPAGLNATALATTSATLNWNAASPAPSNGYRWELRTSGAPGSGSEVATGSVGAGVLTTNVTGLTANTAYSFYVQSDCGGSGTSGWSSAGTFTTPCNPVSTFPWTEGFEGLTAVTTTTAGAQPACWGLVGDVGAGNGAQSSNRSARTGSRYAYVNWSTTAVTGDWMFSPVFSLTAGTSYDFSFWYKTDGLTGWDTLRVAVGNAATTGAMTTRLGTRLNALTNTAYQEYKVSYTPASTGTYHFGVNIWAISNPNFMTFDDFSLQLTPSCLAPTALVAPTFSSFSAGSLGWTASSSNPANGYQWEVRSSGLGGSGAVGLAASGTVGAGVTTANYTGLAANTSYTYYVRANCGGDFSPWASSSSFTTPCAAENAPTVSQDFATFTPACWTEATGTLAASSSLTYGASEWATSTGFANAGTNRGAKINLYDVGNEWLISQPINLGATPGVYRIKYNMAVTSFAGTTAQTTLGSHKVDVVVSTDGGTTWSNANIVKSYTGAGTYSNTGQTETINLSAYSGNVRIAFVSTTTSTSPDIDFHIDNFVVEAIPTLDIKANALIPGAGTTCASATKTLTVQIQNTASVTADFAANPVTVGVRINGRPSVTTVINSGTLAAGATQNVNVTTTFDMSTAGNYTLRGGATFSGGDGDATNDSTAVAVVSADATAALAIPYTQDFNAGTTAPAGWTTTGWTIAASNGRTGNGLFRNLWSSAPSGQFTMAKVGAVSATDGLYFDYRVVNFTGYPATATTAAWGNFKVQVSTDCGSTFTDLATVDNASHTPTTEWTTKKYSLAAYVGQNIVTRVVATWAAGDYYLDFDNVQFKVIPAVDMSATALASPLATGCYTANESVIVTIKNEGSATINFATNNVTVVATATNPAGVVTNFSPVVVNTGTLAAGATRNVTISTNYNMSLPSTDTDDYLFTATASVIGDGESTNDAMPNTFIYVEPTLATPYSQNFETAPFDGWTGIAATGALGIALNAPCLPNSALFLQVTSAATNFQGFAPKTGALNASSAVRFKYALTTGANCTALTIGTNKIIIEGSTDCGATYVKMDSIFSGNHTNANTLASRTIRLDAVPALAGFSGKTLKVRFRSVWTTGTVRLWVDDYEVYTDLPTDVQAQLLVTPTTTIAAAAAQTVTIRVRNNGSSALNLATTPITLTSSATSPSAAVTNFTPVVLNTGTLASGATQDVVVATASYDMSAAGTYIFNASATVSGDANTSNDAMSATSVNAYAPFAYDITIDSTNFTSIMSTGSPISGWAQSSTFAISDEGWSGILDLTGFNFKYQGVKVNGLRVNTNGFLTFETQFVTGGFFTPTTQLATISSFENRRIAPFWSDMVLTGSTGDAALLGSSASPIKYQVSGAPGSRVLTVEWSGMEKFANAGPDMNFQTKFYEATERVEFVYGTMKGFDGATNTTWDYVTGLSGSLAGNVIAQGSANISNFTATPTALNWVPKCNSRITFVPNAAAVLPTATLTAPSYDEKATAKGIVVGSGVSIDYCQVFRTAGATASSPTFLGTNDGSTTAADVWFRFTTTNVTNNKISLLGGRNFNGNIHLLKDTTGGNMKQIGFINNFGAGLTDTLRTNNLPAGTYFVRIYDTGTTSAGVFNLSVFSVVAPPANDNCAGAIALTVGGTTLSSVSSGNTANATAGAAGCSGTADDDVWYTFTKTGTNPVLVQVTSGAGYNAVMQIYAGGTCTVLGTSTCFNATASGGTEVSAPITTAGTYYVRVYHSANGGTPTTGFNIGVYSPAPNCATLTSPADAANTIVSANANNLVWTAPSGTIAPTSYDVQVSTSPAFGTFVVNTNLVAPASSYTIPAATLAESTTYYWRVIAKNANGSAVSCATRSFSTTGTVPSAATSLTPANAATNVALNQVLSWAAGSGFPTGYDVYFGTSQAAVAARQAGVLVLNNQFVTTYTPTLAGNVTYYWMVVPRNANGPATSTTVFSFTTTLAPPVNDNCAGAIALTMNAANPIAGTTAGATASAAGAGCAGNADDDVWYSFVATSNMTHRITVKGNGSFDPVVAVLGGASCGALGGLQCANSTGAAGEEIIEINGLTSGATYRVLVYSNGGSGSQGTFTVRVNAVSCAPVTALATAFIGSTVVDVTWTPSPTNSLGYEINWRSGTNPWNGPSRLSPTSSAFRILNLTPNTLYTYRFRSVCTEGVGLWVERTVTTLAVPYCSTPVPTIGTVGASVADISWTVAGGTSSIAAYEINWQPVGGAWNGSGRLNTPSLAAYRMPNLTPGTNYNYRMRSLCNNLNEWTGWATGVFTTNAAFTCNAPTLAIDSTGGAVADVSWTPTANTAAYEINWQPVGGVWNGSGRLNNPALAAYRIPNLMPGTTYNYRFRSLCTPINEWSPWSTGTFATDAATGCSSPTPISVTQAASYTDLSWAPTSATSAYEINWQPVGGAWNGTGRLNNPDLAAYRIPNLLANTTYNYRMRSLCVAMNEWAAWTTGSFTTLAGGRLGINASLSMSVYPNPTTDVANVMLNVEEATSVSYVLYNTLGQALIQGESVVDGINPLSLNVNSLPQGTYTLKVIANNQVITRQVVLVSK